VRNIEGVAPLYLKEGAIGSILREIRMMKADPMPVGFQSMNERSIFPRVTDFKFPY
jgi:hypothetical protein